VLALLFVLKIIMHKNLVKRCILFSLGFTLIFYPVASARGAKALSIRVLDSDANHMRIKVEVNPWRLPKGIRPKIGGPLPISFGELLGVPHTSEFDFKVLEAKCSIITAEGTLEDRIFEVNDPEILKNSVSLAPLGWVRDQRIAKLTLRPIQSYGSAEERIFLRSLVLDIQFRKDESAPPVTAVWDGHPDADNFEEVLKHTLANYANAKKYRAKILLQTPPAPQPLFYPGGTYFKITTKKEGIYRVLGKDLQDGGARLTRINPKTLKIYNLGREVPIWVSNKNRETFDKWDAITFYATSPPEEYKTYTDENVYWLTWGGKNGERMKVKNGSIGEPVDAPFSFKITHHGEEDHEYMNPPPSGYKGTRWFWARISAQKGSRDKRYFVIPDLSKIDREKKFTVRFLLQGLTDDPNTDKDHHAVISINDRMIDDCNWSGQAPYYFDGSFSSEFLVEGSNIIKVELPGDQDVFADQIFFDWFEIDWWTGAAQDGALKFRYQAESGPGIYEFRCRDFRKRQVEAYDITDKQAVKRILNLRIEPEITTDVVFQDEFKSENEERSYLVIQSSKIPKPLKVEKIFMKAALRSPQSKADYIIITHSDFIDEVKRLARYRGEQGLRVELVNVEDVYNQFSYGLFTPVAIREFLKFAYHHWKQPAPSYLLLVGDANWDYKDNMGYGVHNYVPTYLVPALRNEDAASDSRFVCISGEDVLPDMHVGRFPVSTKREARIMVNKTIQYEEDKGAGGWKKRILFVADDGFFSEKQSSLISENYLPMGFEATRLNLGDLSLPADMPLNKKVEKTNELFTPRVLEEINKGFGIVQFVGHGGLRVWSHEHILNSRKSADHWEKMTNRGKLPIIFTFSCLNGYFDSPRFPTIAERFLNAQDKGAIAFASNTRDSSENENLFLNLNIYDAIFNLGMGTLGSVVTQAKIQSITDLSDFITLMNTFTLFGDPALRMLLGKALKHRTD